LTGGVNFKDAACFSKETMDEIYMSGDYSNSDNVEFEIVYKACKNDTVPGVVCQSKEKIDSMLNGGFIGYFVIDYIIDPQNYTYPVRPVIRNVYTTFSNLYYKEIAMIFNLYELYTDSGWLVEDESKQSFIKFDRMFEIISFTQQDIFLKIYYKGQFQSDKMVRKYLKIQEVVAQVGGLIKGIYMIFFFATVFFRETNLYTLIGNDLFRFPSDKKRSTYLKRNILNLSGNENSISIGKKNQSKSNDLKLNDTSKIGGGGGNKNNSSYIQLSAISPMKIEKDKNKTTINTMNFQKMEMNNARLKLTFSEFMYASLCRRKGKSLSMYFYNQMLDSLRKNLDFTHVCKRIAEIGLLRDVILDQNQKNIFNFISSNNHAKSSSNAISDDPSQDVIVASLNNIKEDIDNGVNTKLLELTRECMKLDLEGDQ
jgi:hypothetical protein